MLSKKKGSPCASACTETSERPLAERPAVRPHSVAADGRQRCATTRPTWLIAQEPVAQEPQASALHWPFACDPRGAFQQLPDGRAIGRCPRPRRAACEPAAPRAPDHARRPRGRPRTARWPVEDERRPSLAEWSEPLLHRQIERRTFPRRRHNAQEPKQKDSGGPAEAAPLAVGEPL